MLPSVSVTRWWVILTATRSSWRALQHVMKKRNCILGHPGIFFCGGVETRIFLTRERAARFPLRACVSDPLSSHCMCCCCYYMVKGFWCCKTVMGRILQDHSLKRGSREYLRQTGEWVTEARLSQTFVGFRVCQLSLLCQWAFSQRSLSDEEQEWRESPGEEVEVGGWGLWRI